MLTGTLNLASMPVKLSHFIVVPIGVIGSIPAAVPRALIAMKCRRFKHAWFPRLLMSPSSSRP